MARPHLAANGSQSLLRARLSLFLSLSLSLSLSLPLSSPPRPVGSRRSGDDYAYKNVISHREPMARDACGLGRARVWPRRPKFTIKNRRRDARGRKSRPPHGSYKAIDLSLPNVPIKIRP